jgi:hypothetical protein
VTLVFVQKLLKASTWYQVEDSWEQFTLLSCAFRIYGRSYMLSRSGNVFFSLVLQAALTAGWPTRRELWFFSFISPFCCLSRDQLLRTALFKLTDNVMILLHHWNSSSYQTRLLKESLICKRFMVFVSKCFTLHGHGDADERRRGCLLQAWNDRPWVSMQCCAIHHEY